MLSAVEMGNDAAANCQGMFVIQSIVIGNAGYAAVHVCPAEFFRRDFFPRRGFYQRWPSQENSAIAAYNHGFITHCRNVCPSRGTGTHHSSNLWNALA